MTSDAARRAQVSYAVAGRDASDYARDLVRDVRAPVARGERIRGARRLRLLDLTVLDRAVLVELAEGASWDEVAAALGLSVAETRARYEDTWERWSAEEVGDPATFGDFTPGLRGDRDLRGTAESVDSWWVRHAEPWDAAGRVPLVEGFDD